MEFANLLNNHAFVEGTHKGKASQNLINKTMLLLSVMMMIVTMMIAMMMWHVERLKPEPMYFHSFVEEQDKHRLSDRAHIQMKI